MSSVTLVLRNFIVGLGQKLILDGVNLDIGQREILVLMGPGGAGKSTLLRTICGLNDGHGSLQTRGIARYLDAPISGSCRPVLVEQNPKMMTSTVFEYLAKHFPGRSAFTRIALRAHLIEEFHRCVIPEYGECLDEEMLSLSTAQRRLLIIFAAQLKRPALLCVDEPTTELEEAEAQKILHFLVKQKEERSILMVTHNQRHGRQVGDYTALLAGGKIQEHLPTEEFFFNPQSELTRAFIRTGSCTVASPGARPEDLEPSYAGKPRFVRGETPVNVPSLRAREIAMASAASIPSECRGPYGFHWMRPGKTAGTPMPGIVRPIEEDLQALRRVEVSLLITLSTTPLPPEALAPYEIDNLHFPIVDMHSPSPELAAQICAVVDERLAEGEVIAFHCRAGIGRTGTMLAAYEIWRGRSATEAFEAARRVHQRWVQSRAQREFLSEFERWLE